MKKKVLIIDDDAMSQRALERMVQANEKLELAYVAADGLQALQFLENQEVDLILLDVEMPNMTGTEFLAQLPDVPNVIFTTGKSEYAVDAFEFRANDFLKKPISPARFNTAIDQIFEETKITQTSSDRSEGIFVKENGKYIRLNPDDILFFENVGDYVRVKSQNSSHIIYGTLKSIEEKLDDTRFMKVHRSYIVNLTKIKDIDDVSVVVDKTPIPVSRAHRHELMASIKIL